MRSPGPEELLAEMGSLIEDLARHPDQQLREQAMEIVRVVMELHGEGLRRLFACLESLPNREEVFQSIRSDELLDALLLLHGLGVLPLQDRIAAAMPPLRTHLLAQHVDIDLVGVFEGRARLRLIRHGHGAPPVETLKAEVEDALLAAAPDLLGVDIDGMNPAAHPPNGAHNGSNGLSPVSNLKPRPPKLVQIQPTLDKQHRWIAVIRAGDLPENEIRTVKFEEKNMLLLNFQGSLHAYENNCPTDTSRELDDGLLEVPMLTCSCHGHQYDLRSGRCMQHPELKLTALAVMLDNQVIKVAL